MGNGLCWTSPAIHKIKAEDCEPSNSCDITHTLNADQASWTASLWMIGALVASQVLNLSSCKPFNH